MRTHQNVLLFEVPKPPRKPMYVVCGLCCEEFASADPATLYARWATHRRTHQPQDDPQEAA